MLINNRVDVMIEIRTIRQSQQHPESHPLQFLGTQHDTLGNATHS